MATMTYVPSRLGEGFFIDVPVPGSGDDDKALTYDHGTGEFVYVAFDAAGTATAAVAAHVAASDPHTQYELESNNTASAILTKVLTVDGAGSGLDADLLDGNSSAAFLRASGADTGATSSRQVFTQGITTGNIRPESDTTTSIQFQNAAGTKTYLMLDTISGAVYANRGTEYANLFFGGGGNNTATGNFNVALNVAALSAITSGEGNMAIGQGSLNLTTIGKWNVGVGTNTLLYNTIGNSNVAIGQAAGALATIYSGCVYIGFLAGINNSLDNKLYIANTDSKSLLFGDFSANTLAIGFADLTVGTAAVDAAPSTTARASLRIRSGTAPTTPNAGDTWFDGTNLKFYDGSATRTITWT